MKLIRVDPDQKHCCNVSPVCFAAAKLARVAAEEAEKAAEAAEEAVA